MNEMKNGDAWGRHMADYVKRHWVILGLLFTVAGWVVKVEAQTKDRYTGAQAAKDKAEIMLIVQEQYGQIREDMTVVKEDVAYIKGKVEILSSDHPDTN